MPCRAHLVEVRDRYQEIQQAGACVVAITFAEPLMLKLFTDEGHYPFPVLGDPSRSVYRAFGLQRATWGRILHPRVILGYLGFLFRGWAPRRGRRGEDYLQLGGDFLLDSSGKVVFAHRSEDPTDRPSIDLLLREIRRLQTEEGHHAGWPSSDDSGR
ncbi:MAG: peroxiredoxin-like family protein [Gemmataceae bacterium]